MEGSPCVVLQVCTSVASSPFVNIATMTTTQVQHLHTHTTAVVGLTTDSQCARVNDQTALNAIVQVP